MARVQTFTRCALRFLIHDPDMPDTVREWLEDENEPEQRALLFAIRLSEDFLETFRDGPCQVASFNASERRFYMRLIDLASRRVNWRCVAECLLKRFATSTTPSTKREAVSRNVRKRTAELLDAWLEGNALRQVAKSKLEGELPSPEVSSWVVWAPQGLINLRP